MLQLQKIELEIIRTETALKRLQTQAEEVSRKMEELRERRENIARTVEELKGEIRKHREWIEECKEGARRAEERLNHVRKAEEYKALLREKARYEDCVIKLTSSLRGLEEKLRRLEEEKEDIRLIREMQELEEELADLRYSQSRLADRAEELRSALQGLRENTGEDILREYEALKKKHGLPIILPVDSPGACANCGTKLPSALYSRLIKGEVVTCPSCGRLAYHEGET